MSKKRFKIGEFAAEHGLTLGRHCCYGEYKGYRVHVRYRAMGNPACLITVVTDTKGRDKQLEKFLEKNKKELKLTNYGVVGIGLMVAPQLYANIFRQIGEILDKIIRFLKKEGYPGAEICPYCGTPLGEHPVDMWESDIPFRAHAACYERAYAAVREKEKREAELPDKKLLGSCGALLGALAGCVAFILMFIWWNFAAIAAAVGVLLGGWLYGKFGGKNSPFKVFVCAAIPLVLTYGVFLLCLVLQANTDLGAAANAFDKIAANLAAGGQYLTMFILNAVFIAVFALVGTAYNLFSYLRSRKKISAQMRREGE